jgi:hypothetical protein
MAVIIKRRLNQVAYNNKENDSFETIKNIF